MSYENKGSMGPTVTVSREPDRSGNFICDGTADDVQIQAAIDVLPTVGGTVLIKGGVYDISTAILIQNMTDVVLAGNGWQSTRLVTSGVDTICILIGDRANAGLSSQSIIVRGLFIDGTSQTAETAITPEVNDRRLGIEFASPAQQTTDILIENCYVYNTGSDSIYGYVPGRFIVQNNIVEGTRGHWAGIHTHGGDNDGQVLGNIVFDCACSGIRHGKLIMGNYVEGCGLANETNGREASIVGGRDHIIVGNAIRPVYAGGIVSIKTFDRMNSISHNVTLATPTVAVVHIDGSYGHRIISNVAYDVLCASGFIYADLTVGCAIVNNSVDRCEEGINLEGSQNCVVAGNIIRNASKGTDGAVDAIIIQSSGGTHSTGNIVNENQIYSTIANEPRYGINEADVNQDYNVIKDNVIANVVTALANINGPNTRLAKAQFQFTEPIGAAAIIVASPTGIDVDANTEGALAWGQVPVEAQEVQRIKIWAVATDAPIGGGGQMHLELTFNAGASNAAYNEAGKSWTLANFDGEEADYVANDVVHWVIEDGDVGSEISNLVAGDSFELLVTHEAGADPDGATDALFRVVEIEYV